MVTRRAYRRSRPPSRRQTHEAHRPTFAAALHVCVEARSSILDGVEQFKSSSRLDRKLRSDLRLVERAVAALDRDVLGP